MSENTSSERLRADYKGAFDEWASQVARLQAGAGGPCDVDKKQAQERATAAELAYRHSRDRLTEHMGLAGHN